LTRFGLDWIRRRQRTFARSVLALFCVVWLQAALAPCAMALVPGQASAAPEEHCTYCPPAHERHDGGTNSTCAFPDKPQSDTRAPAVAFAALPALPLMLVLAPVAPAAEGAASEPSRPPEDAGPTLAVSYCRFLK
jgi:hypothetical protein